MQYSVIIPVYNEARNIFILYKEIISVMNSLNNDYEVIFIDDGSKDNSYEILEQIHNNDKKVKVILQRKNFGQSAALDAGIKLASGNILITMDGDLQNDPNDIPFLLSKLDKGYDAVSGWRWKRKDPFNKILFSSISKVLRRFVIKDALHDSGCALKAYKRECFDDFTLNGEMHRYIAELLQLNGFKIGEIKVKHRPRRYGKTKYGTKRVIKGFFDLFLVWFWQKYSGRPLHLFGGLGFTSISLGFLSFIYIMYLRIFKNVDLSDHFLSVISVFLIFIGVQFFVSGIMTDLMVKNYYKDKKIYKIKKILK